MFEFIHMIMCDINLAGAYRARLIHHVNAIPFQVFKCAILFHFHKIYSLKLKPKLKLME